MIVLDTHIWLWCISNPEKLFSRAAEAIEKAVQKNGVVISSISTWEVALLVEKGRLGLSVDVRDWVQKPKRYHSLYSCRSIIPFVCARYHFLAISTLIRLIG